MDTHIQLDTEEIRRKKDIEERKGDKKVEEVQTGKNLIVSESGLGRSQLCGLKKF